MLTISALLFTIGVAACYAGFVLAVREIGVSRSVLEHQVQLNAALKDHLRRYLVAASRE